MAGFTDYFVINTLAANHTHLFLGGSFTELQVPARNHLAAVDKATGILTEWNPNANGIVSTLVLTNDTIYIGGEFSQITGLQRPHLAALDTSASNASPSGLLTVRRISISVGFTLSP